MELLIHGKNGQTHTLEITHVNEHVKRILEALGTEQVIDALGDLEFAAKGGPGILVLGDDAWGSVTSVATWNGHLLLVANFGDEGNFIYSPTLFHEGCEVETDLPEELREQLDEDHPLTAVDLWVNPLREYSVAVSYTV